jgi:hypothetical protein
MFLAPLGFCSPELLAYSDRVSCVLEAVEENLGVAIRLGDDVEDTWKSVDYRPVTDENQLLRYLELLEKEFSKYPSGYLSRAHAGTLVIGADLMYCHQPRAAVPDPYRNQLFLSVNGAFGIASTKYLVHVMHHELHHCTEFGIWRNMTFDWPEWQLLNDDGFCYGNGGRDAYELETARGIDFYSPSNPREGFINRYSLLGDEEDRAEMIAFLMNDLEKEVIVGLIARDAVLQRKSALLMQLLHHHTGYQLSTELSYPSH